MLADTDAVRQPDTDAHCDWDGHANLHENSIADTNADAQPVPNYFSHADPDAEPQSDAELYADAVQ